MKIFFTPNPLNGALAPGIFCFCTERKSPSELVPVNREDSGVKLLILNIMTFSLLVIDELFFIIFLNGLNPLFFLARKWFEISSANGKTAKSTR